MCFRQSSAVQFRLSQFQPHIATKRIRIIRAPTYSGPDQIIPADTRFVKEIRLLGAFEGVVTWVIGLSESRPFVASSVPGPTNLSIEFATA